MSEEIEVECPMWSYGTCACRTQCPDSAVDRDELMDVISHEGAVCGDCATEPGDWRECEDCTRVIGRYADELLARYEIRRREA